MYKIVIVEDKIRVPPLKFSMNLEKAVSSSLEDRWSGITERDLGVVLAVVSIKDVGEGKILPGDGAIHYPVKFRLLIYKPEQHEIIKGNVIDVTEFGVFVNLGPIDGMVHVSQIMDDFVSYDQKNAVFSGRESRRILRENDVIRARIISVSVAENQYKIGLTMRQFGLGVLSWLEREKKERKTTKKPEPKHKKPKKKKRILKTQN